MKQRGNISVLFDPKILHEKDILINYPLDVANFHVAAYMGRTLLYLMERLWYLTKKTVEFV